MAEILGITAFSHGSIINSWWNVVLIAILGACVLFGLAAIFWRIVKLFKRFNKKNNTSSALVHTACEQFTCPYLPRSSNTHSTLKPSSFGVYLGPFSYHLTELELRLFSQWKVLVLDPYQQNVVHVVEERLRKEPLRVILRFDISVLLESAFGSKEVKPLEAIKTVVEEIWRTIIRVHCDNTTIGVLVAGWTSMPLLNAITAVLRQSSLEVYLEITPPDFLEIPDAPVLESYSGVLIRNGTILENGEPRDYFTMEKLRSTTRAFVGQSCLRPFLVMMWEALDDDVSLSHAVMKRSYSWCSYHGAVTWISFTKGLKNVKYCKPSCEPIAAFQWLKENRTMKLEPMSTVSTDMYRDLSFMSSTIQQLVETSRRSSIESTVHSNSSTLTTQHSDFWEEGVLPEGFDITFSKLDWTEAVEKVDTDPLSSSSSGDSYTGLGCFPVGFHQTHDDFQRVLQSQQRLRNLGLLEEMSAPELLKAAEALKRFDDPDRVVPGLNIPKAMRHAIRYLRTLMEDAASLEDSYGCIKIFRGLSSGFRVPGNVNFWGVYEVDSGDGSISIYLSKSVANTQHALLHTFMSCKSFDRYQCFRAEFILHQLEASNTQQQLLPPNIEQDLNLLSPTDSLIFLQHMKFSRVNSECKLLSGINIVLRYLLLEAPSRKQLENLSHVDYLARKISEEDLVETRLTWYRQTYETFLDPSLCLQLFREVDAKFQQILFEQNFESLDQLTMALESLLEHGTPNCQTDFFLFSIFCAARRAAFEEVYLEVTDRNPLFNEFSDQSAAFSELFALGSRCESYFGIVPSAFGKLLSDRHRAYYSVPERQPPLWLDNAPSFASVYAAAQTDIDPAQPSISMPGYRRFTFLSVFAIPALIDILLLVSTGRGLYLSAFMSEDELRYATLALMLSLLLSGAIGTAISIGETYYLVSMAFSAANMFVLTRLIGGLALTIAGGVIGFIVIAALHSIHLGATFFFYLFGLTSYLSVLAVLAGYQFPGSSFLNGRYIIITLIPTLLISPLVTTWINGHDIIIYLGILHIFVALLFLGTRRISSRWVTWLKSIKAINDSQVKEWYIKNRADNDEKALNHLNGPSALNLCRAELYRTVEAEGKLRFWQKSKADSLVQELAKSWESTIFLLDWYCRLADVKRPLPYSSTWNLEIQVALDSLLQNQKGIRLHNAFIHWRNAGDEIGCGVLYFFVALLDRWIALVAGGQLVGLSLAANEAFRIAVGCGLAYYLIGAVLLDYNAGHLHQMAQQATPVSIPTTDDIHKARVNDAKFKRKLYWTTLARFLHIHVWALALSAGLVWIFAAIPDALIMFLSYVGAYTGLLFYQYNKIFAGPHALIPLFMACVFGFGSGLVLRLALPDWIWNDVIALAIATWTAAFLCLAKAKIGLPGKETRRYKLSSSHFHAYGGIGTDHEWSQSELESFYETLLSGPSQNCFGVLSQGHPGNEIKEILLSCAQNGLSYPACDAFPETSEMLRRIVSLWDVGRISISLISFKSIIKAEADIRAISSFRNDHLHLVIASDAEQSTFQGMSVSSNCRAIAETLIHACAEEIFGIEHNHAVIAESLLVCDFTRNDAYQVSECVKRAVPFDFSESKVAHLVESARKELIHNLCVGVRETSWNSLPPDMRVLFVQRCLNDTCRWTKTALSWISANIEAEEGCTIATRLARYDLGAVLAISKCNYLKYQVPLRLGEKTYQQRTADIYYYDDKPQPYSPKTFTQFLLKQMKVPFARSYHSLGTIVKFFAIAITADPEFQRELDYMISEKPHFVAAPSSFLLNCLWIYTRFAQSLVFPFFLLCGRDEIKTILSTITGAVITLKPGRVLIDTLDKKTTAFIKTIDEGVKLTFYNGIVKQEPAWGATRISTFSKDLLLLSREDLDGHEVQNKYIYEYSLQREKRISTIVRPENLRIPMVRKCVAGTQEGAVFYYNNKGLIESGSYMQHGNLVRFKYRYRKNAKYADELLRAEFVLPHIFVSVSWCAPPIRHPEKTERWIPHSRVHEATFVQGADVYESTWLYDHKFHPTITTKLNGQAAATPDMIRHDWLGVLKKPTSTSFVDDNPLVDFRSLSSNIVTRTLGKNKKRIPVSTSTSRSHLWRAWKTQPHIDGVVIRWLDEQLMRGEPLLKQYWTKRDCGKLDKAEDYLALHADAIMATTELSNEVGAWTPLAIRMGDLSSFGQGGDAIIYTRTKTLQPDTDDRLHVIAVDTGTWPNEGGGVSACRRDLINNLRSVRWHMVVESASDFGIPKHQTEENVESLKVVPLWGIDFMHPHHGIFTNKLDGEIDMMVKDNTIEDIRLNFVPILTALVRGARSIKMSSADIKQATRALVNLNTYFEDSRHWKEVWTSDVVKESWRNLWLEEIPNAKPPSEWFETEWPTLGHFDTALDLWFRYLFIFSVPIPERIPSVFQSSHHSVSASYGIVCKIKRNCTLQVWDHAISWRETNLYLSSAMCTLPPFIRNALLGLMRLTSVLVLHHADQVLPCADFFNPGWEIEIGSSEGTLTHRNVFKRKVDPIVNGITDMQKFAPVSEIKTKSPTVTMLSHLWLAKDIKGALLAADIIINKWGFEDYTLDIYGALNKAPVYSSECQEIIASKGLGEKVTLRGTADPSMVLSNTWVFLNSSVSEGLPLALGEAALTGAPVVCTDVGASLRVLTDPDDNRRYSEVVAPNDALSLARAQINLLAMLGEWSKYADDDPTKPAPILPVAPTKKDVEIITKRMYEKTAQRRKLGMMARSIVQKSFSGERYLREHEQMLWIGKACYEMLDIPKITAKPLDQVVRPRATKRKSNQIVDEQLERMVHPPRPAWLKHTSTSTSFSSVYMDDSKSTRASQALGPFSRGQYQRDALVDLESGVSDSPARAKFKTGLLAGREIPPSRASIPMAASGKSSMSMKSAKSRAPSGLSQVLNATAY
ncbi:glycosyltransferase family 4 protein [Patellaria atrata CBS 101060]|uniref:Glycosyltransferase family 4 protein n=1 Tax=Patellaria atrata CBS 101060 TaxID=1346257 RepID=A0A9P4S746_9PEZI|nr:glycosyltransferase family 4 protein [Patellaria atrata CBS 101060]